MNRAEGATELGSLNIGQVVSVYVAQLAEDERVSAAPELRRFVRWCGSDRLLSGLAPFELERYQEQSADGSASGAARLDPLRRFFSYAHKRRLTPTNLAPVIRVRKATARSPIGRQPEQERVVQVRAEGHAKLRSELERLQNEEAPRVRAELQSAYADKDFRENAPYDAAKLRLGELQGRINTLKATLADASIVENSDNAEVVGLGSAVLVHDLEHGEELTYTLVGPGEMDAGQGKISLQSPVGRALNGRTTGEEVQVETPAGTARYVIKRVS